MTDPNHTSAEVERLQREIEKSKGNLREAVNQLARLRARNKQLKRTRDALIADLEHAVEALREGEIRSSADKAEANAARWELERAKARKWARLGRLVEDARREPWKTLTLPFEAIGVLFAPSQLPTRPIAAPPDPTAVDRMTRKVRQHELRKRGPLFPAVAPDTRPPTRKLRVAVVLDEFSEAVFAPEFEMLPLGRDDWHGILNDGVDFLLVESAWRGSKGAWSYQLAKTEGPKPEFVEMVTAFRDAGVPTAFWNKEDPPNYPLFVGSAALFDHVFTVAEECIDAYRRDLGHDRVHLLPFSAQPRIHNPVMTCWTPTGGEFTLERTRDVLFAGSYFTEKHPKRREQMETVLKPALEFDLDIFSRYDETFLKENPNRRWPDEYEVAIAGTLDYQDLLLAQKTFKVAINVNSVPDSTSMCARRVFELLAGGTPIVSAPSPAIAEFFGDTVLQAGSADESRRQLRLLLESPAVRDRLRVRGLRQVMREHTTSHRVARMLEVIGLDDDHDSAARPLVSLIIPTKRPEKIDHILANVGSQTYPNIEVVLMTHGFDIDKKSIAERFHEAGVGTFKTLSIDERHPLGVLMNQGMTLAEGEYLGKIDDDDLLGPEFVWDQMDAFVYSDADLVGKKTHFRYIESANATLEVFPGFSYRYVDHVLGCALIGKANVMRSSDWGTGAQGSDTEFLNNLRAKGAVFFATSPHNFVYMRYSRSDHHTFSQAATELMARGTVIQFGLNTNHLFV